MESGENYRSYYSSSRFNSSSKYPTSDEEESPRYPRLNQSNNYDRIPKGGFNPDRQEELPDVDFRRLSQQPIPLSSRYRSSQNDVQSRAEGTVVYPRTSSKQNRQHSPSFQNDIQSQAESSVAYPRTGYNQPQLTPSFQNDIQSRAESTVAYPHTGFGYNQKPQHTPDGAWNQDKSFYGENQRNFKDINRDRDQLRDHLHNRDGQWNPERSYGNRDNFQDKSREEERTTDLVHDTNQWNSDRSFPGITRNNFQEKQQLPHEPALAQAYFSVSTYNATGNLDTSFQDKSENNFLNKEQLPQQHPVPSQIFPPYNCNATNSYVDNSRQTHAMLLTQNSVPNINSQMGINPMTPSNLPVNPSSIAVSMGIPGSTINPFIFNGSPSPMAGIGMAMNPTNLPVNPSPTAVPIAAGINITQIPGSEINPSIIKDIQPPIALNINTTEAAGSLINPCTFVTNITKNDVTTEKKAPASIKLPGNEVIKLTRCVLYPPKTRWNPNPPARPFCCKSVTVVGLPAKATEEVIREMFEICGEVLKIVRSRGNSWHIRFSSEECAEKAIHLSLYRIQVEDKNEFEYAGKIHIDYAEPKDDPQEFEIQVQQRKLLREARHRKAAEPKINKEKIITTPKPPSVKHFSQLEASLIHKKLRSDDTFEQAVYILTTWFERGECTKWTASFFYSMIQSVNSHVRRLLGEKVKHEEEFNKAKMSLQQQMQGILLQYNQISKVFDSVSVKKVWDTFTKIQRKNIEIWKKQTEEIKNAHIEEFLQDRIEDEMDVSEDEEEKDESMPKKTCLISDQEKVKYEEELDKLRKENSELRIKLEAAENETIVLKSESSEKDRLIKALKHDLENSTEEMKKLNQKRSMENDEIEELRAFKSRHLDKNNQDVKTEYSEFGADNWASMNVQESSSEDETYLITRVSMFLLVHQSGADADEICSYLKKTNPTIQPSDVESLMDRFSTVFQEVSDGQGPKKWICNSNV